MPSKINIEEHLKYLEVRWPKESIRKLKMKLFSKGLIDECQCKDCELDQDNLLA